MQVTTRFLIVFVVVLSSAFALAQNARKSIVQGNVLDDSTHAPIYGANVFLASTTLGASADSSGRFLIRNVPPGTYDIVASCIGYTLKATRIVVASSEPVSIDIRLRAAELRMQVVEVTATRSDEWKENLKTFTRLLLGAAPVASRCFIVNPEAVHFSSGMFGELQATADKEIVVENSAFGYCLHAFLETFVLRGRSLILETKIRFEEHKSNDREAGSEWSENRDEAYFGSVRHFFKSLANDELSSEGYAIFGIESLAELRKASPRIELKRGDIVRKSPPNDWLVSFPNYLVVTYDRKQIEVEPDQFYGDINSFKDRSIETRKSRPQMGILSLTKGSLAVDTEGHILDRLGLRVLGDWGNDGLANELPLDFHPKTRR